MSSDREESPPVASSAAWSPTAAPSQVLPLLNFDDPEILAAIAREREAPEPEAPAPEAPEPHAAEPEAPQPDDGPAIVATTTTAEPATPRADRLAALRDIARKLRQAPDAEETLQMIIDVACECTGSDAGMLTITQPEHRQVVSGSALGAGPYISVQLRAGGPTFGEIVLTRMSDEAEFLSEDETFAELVAEYVAKAVGAMRRGTVLSDEQQDFLDRVTEELRAPMAGTRNFLAVLLDGTAGPLTEEQRGYVTAAAADTARLLRMVDDLLALARLRPPEPREMESIPVGPWLRRIVREHQKTARLREIELSLREPGEALMVKGVPAQLDLVMEHLLANALKFTDAGGHVEVSAGISEGMMRVTVEDNGIGFDAADGNRMLDLFARAINAEAMKIPGIGLGLFLCAEIAKNHSGRVWLEGRRDEGTHAYLAIPPMITDAAL